MKVMFAVVAFLLFPWSASADQNDNCVHRAYSGWGVGAYGQGDYAPPGSYLFVDLTLRDWVNEVGTINAGNTSCDRWLTFQFADWSVCDYDLTVISQTWEPQRAFVAEWGAYSSDWSCSVEPDDCEVPGDGVLVRLAYRVANDVPCEFINNSFHMGNSSLDCDEESNPGRATAGPYPTTAHHGDVDLDGDVDLTDLQTLNSNYGQTSGMTWYDGDMDWDFDVDLDDLQALLANYGESCD